MKTGLESADPKWFAVLRVAGAGVVVFAVSATVGRLRPPPRHDVPVVLSVGAGANAFNLILIFIALYP